jgi:hypothetical protein
MATQRAKTLSYRRAQWFAEGSAPNLEKCLRNALAQLKTIEDRTIFRDGRSAKVAKAQNDDPCGLFLHIATETPGEPASVVPKVDADAIALDLKTEDPPDDGEWLDGDAFVYLNENHVCLCTTGLHDKAVPLFIRYLFMKAKLPQNYAQFALIKAADISRLAMIQKQGVKELELRGVLYEVTADYVRRKVHVTGGLLGVLGKEIRTLLDRPHDVNPDSLQVTISLKVDGRGKHLVIGERDIQELASDVIINSEADDDYVIITKAGQKITPQEIFVKTTSSIDADGKTVDRDGAWQELQKFYNQLHSTGVLEQ